MLLPWLHYARNMGIAMGGTVEYQSEIAWFARLSFREMLSRWLTESILKPTPTGSLDAHAKCSPQNTWHGTLVGILGYWVSGCTTAQGMPSIGRFEISGRIFEFIESLGRTDARLAMGACACQRRERVDLDT